MAEKPTNTEKPTNPQEYETWLKDKLDVVIDAKARTYYDAATRAMLDHLERADFWQGFKAELLEYDARYTAQCGFFLLMDKGNSLEVVIKPFDSLVDKTFRKNILANENFPDAPEAGWVTPTDWLTRVHDVVRTSIAVKYLDGVTFLAERIDELAQKFGRESGVDYEAREEGYYAAHVGVPLPAEIPSKKWDTDKIVFTLEIQITTQIQEAIRTLTHAFYEKRRSATQIGKKWQWDYDSDEFRANYLAHTLHHMEGLIMDIRARGVKQSG